MLYLTIGLAAWHALLLGVGVNTKPIHPWSKWVFGLTSWLTVIVLVCYAIVLMGWS